MLGKYFGFDITFLLTHCISLVAGQVFITIIESDNVWFNVIFIQAPVEWESVDVTPVMGLDGKTQIPPAAIESVNQNKIGLKGKVFFLTIICFMSGVLWSQRYKSMAKVEAEFSSCFYF